MKNAVLLKKIAILAFFTFFSGISHVQSMEKRTEGTGLVAELSFHTQLETNLTTALSTYTKLRDCHDTPAEERAKFATTVALIQKTTIAWAGLKDFIEPASFDAIFSRMHDVYKVFLKNQTRNLETVETDNKIILKNNIAFADFIRKNWDAFVRACEFIGNAHLTPQKMFLLLTTINTYGSIASTKALAQFNEPGNEVLKLASLDGEMLVLLTQSYEYILTTANRGLPVFGITSPMELQNAFTRTKKLPKEATTQEIQSRQLALGDLFTIVLKVCSEQNIFSVYEDNRVAVNLDAAAAILGITDVPKKLRRAKRKETDPAHRIFATIIAFIPLILMSTMNTWMAQYCGENGAFAVMMLNICTMLTGMLWGNGKLVTALSWMNPMRLAPLMWLIRSAGHSTIDYFVAKKGSISFLKPVAWITTKGQQLYQTWMIGKFIVPIICGILSSIISVGSGIAGSAYGMAVDMLATLPSLVFGGGETVPA